MFRLDDQVAVVTGGNRGLGFAIASGLAQVGAHVIIIARNQEKSEEAVVKIRTDGGLADYYLCDLSILPDCKQIIDEIRQKHNHIDILVNNAGINKRRELWNISIDEFDNILKTNLYAPFVLSQSVSRLMATSGHGKIINIASLSSTYGLSRLASYASSKGGLLQLTRVLAVELANHNIQVNAIVPGFIRTELNEDLWGKPELSQWILGNTPAGRSGKPSDLVGAAIFLASSASNFITGSAINVDGGFLGGGAWAID